MSVTKYPGDQPATKRRKMSHSSELKPQVASIAATPTQSRSFVLDHLIEELLAEVKPDYESQLSRLQPTLQRIISVIDEAPVRSPVNVADAERSLQKVSGIVIPFPEPRPSKETQYHFEFQKPESVRIAGDSSADTYLKGPRTADVVVRMPASMFQKKDYMNNRALHKRAFYLACIAAALKAKASDEFSLEYDFLDNISCLPLLIITPTEKSPSGFIGSKCSVRILVTISADTIPLDKTLPIKNCIRPPGGALAEDNLEPTPFYNSCLRAVASLQSTEATTKSASKTCPSFGDACRLGRVWLRQRGLDSPISKGGFGPKEWTILCALLFRFGGHKGRPLLSPRFSSLQIFKVMLRFLAESDLKNPLVVDSHGLKLKKSDLPVIYDGSTGVNLFFKMTPSSYEALRVMAVQSVSTINGSGSKAFEETFISRIDEVFLRFDECWSIDMSSLCDGVFDFMKSQELVVKISSLLLRGFGDRVQRFDMQLPATGPWKINDSPKQASRSNNISVRLLLNPDSITRLVDRGPSAEDLDDAADFREFWGSKAELRRFKDGAICESLVWSNGTPVTLQIAQHLLEYRLGIRKQSISWTIASATVESQILPPPPYSLTAADTFQLVHRTYQDLTNTLLQIKELPLRIKATAPLDSCLSSSSLEPLSHYPVNVHIEFEDSPHWPDTLPAAENTKAAFLIKLADALDESSPHLTIRVGVENQSRCSTIEEVDSQYSYFFNRSFLDVIYPSAGSGIPKIAFRIRIHNPRTTLLLKSTLQSLASSKKVLRDLATQALADSTAPTQLAAHTLAIRTLCSKHPVLSSSIRLLKKWTASHLLSPHISSQIIELIAVAALPIPQTNETPGTATIAFLRALNFLAKWDWLTEPLAISLDPTKPQLPHETDTAIRTAFAMWRQNDPALHRVAVVVGTNLDFTGTIWTRQQPSRSRSAQSPAAVRGISAVIMKRWSSLAEHAIGVVAGWHSSSASSGSDTTTSAAWPWRAAIFRTPLSDYDFLIHLKPRLVRSSPSHKRQKHEAGDVQFKNLALTASGELDAGVNTEEMGFDLMQLFVDDIETAFGSAALFFWDVSGEGKVVAGLWRPDVLGRKRIDGLDVATGKGMGFAFPVMPAGQNAGYEGGDQEGGVVVINQASILAQIAQMGAGMVERVEKVKDFVV